MTPSFQNSDPAQVEPSALVAAHLDYAAVLAYLGFLVGLVRLASLENSLFPAVIASHSIAILS
jgi:hypothetical protein